MSSNNLKSRKQNRKRAITALENAPYSQSKRQKYANHHQLYNNRIELERITINPQPHPYSANTNTNTTNKGWREKHPIRSCRRKTNYRLLNVYGANYRQQNTKNAENTENNENDHQLPIAANNNNSDFRSSSSSKSKSSAYSSSSSMPHTLTLTQNNNNNHIVLHDSSCSVHRKPHHNAMAMATNTNMPWKTITTHPANPDIPIYVLSEDEDIADPPNANNNTDDDSISITTQETATTVTMEPIVPIVDQKGYMQFTPGLIICKQYAMIRQLGKGTFSRVFECNDIHSPQRRYAVKVIRNVYKYQLAAQTELAILHKIRRHDSRNTSCCIHILHDAEYRGHPIFVFPLLTRSIYSFMVHNGCKPFKYSDAISLMYQICHGVAYIHSLNIIITDLKPENIVLVNDEIFPMHSGRNSAFCAPKSTQIKLIDFGSAVYDDGSGKIHKHLIQTRHYRAPEVVFKLPWTFSADIWSVGCILVELLYGKMLFNTHDSIDHLNQMVKCIDPPPSGLLELIDDGTWNDYFDSRGALNMFKAKRSPVQCKKLLSYFKGKPHERNSDYMLLYDLCTKMLCWNPEDRITAKEALQHKVFQNFNVHYAAN